MLTLSFMMSLISLPCSRARIPIIFAAQAQTAAARVVANEAQANDHFALLIMLYASFLVVKLPFAFDVVAAARHPLSLDDFPCPLHHVNELNWIRRTRADGLGLGGPRDWGSSSCGRSE